MPKCKPLGFILWTSSLGHRIFMSWDHLWITREDHLSPTLLKCQVQRLWIMDPMVHHALMKQITQFYNGYEIMFSKWVESGHAHPRHYFSVLIYSVGSWGHVNISFQLYTHLPTIEKVLLIGKLSHSSTAMSAESRKEMNSFCHTGLSERKDRDSKTNICLSHGSSYFCPWKLEMTTESWLGDQIHILRSFSLLFVFQVLRE